MIADPTDERTHNDVDASGSLPSTVTLPGGVAVPIRPIDPTDTPALQRFHSRLSETSVYYRFFESMPRLADTLAHYFTHLDGVNRYALVALDPANPEEIIGVVRYDRLSHQDRAEYAIVVADAWQGRGLGLALTRALIAAARAHGIDSLEAVVLLGNPGMLRLFRRLGLPMHIDEGPELLVRIDIRPADEWV
jgi:RimJ/RimL family protein N-acetyltransferase